MVKDLATAASSLAMGVCWLKAWFLVPFILLTPRCLVLRESTTKTERLASGSG